MGLADHQAVLIAHNDTDNEHVHIVVNRIGDDGRAWRPFRDMPHAHEAIPCIEIDYGLSRTGRDQAPPTSTPASRILGTEKSEGLS
jgi:hypothetical protein